jgi:hypothetical protein
LQAAFQAFQAATGSNIKQQGHQPIGFCKQHFKHQAAAALAQTSSSLGSTSKRQH